MKKTLKLKRHKGFTLIEVIIVVAILSALTASAIYSLSPGDKITSAEETGLKQILISRVPTELIQYRLTNGSVKDFKLSSNSVAFMKAWPGVKATPDPKFALAAPTLTLEMQTTFDATKLEEILDTMPNITAKVTNKVLKVEYTVK